jgi:hypothetical protein
MIELNYKQHERTKKMKKLTTILLTIAIILSLPLAASANEFTTADALAVLRASVGLSPLTAAQAARFEISGTPTTADALRILRISIGLSGTAPQRESISASDRASLTAYINQLSGTHISKLPHFTNINDVPLEKILMQYLWHFRENADINYDIMQSLEQLGLFISGSAQGVYPNNLDRFMKENLNPNFSIERYNYKSHNEIIAPWGVLWDNKNEAIVLWTGAWGGGAAYTIEVIDAYKIGDIYYVITSSFWYEFDILGDLLQGEIQYSIYTFRKNNNGVFNIHSIQPTTAIR